jgi:hypothetical protein
VTNSTVSRVELLTVGGHTPPEVNSKVRNSTLYSMSQGRVPDVFFLPKYWRSATNAQVGGARQGNSCTFRDKTCVCHSRLALLPGVNRLARLPQSLSTLFACKGAALPFL